MGRSLLNKIVKWVVACWLGIAIALGSSVTSLPATGFVLDDALTYGTPADFSDDLLDAARWSNDAQSLVEQGVRGLGGGLEYAIAADFCAALLPQFIDRPRPTCSDLQRALQQAFDRWADGHPQLRFVNASASLAAQLPPSDTNFPAQGFGAEIDLFAFTPQDYPDVTDYGAYTTFWFLNKQPIGTNHRRLSGKTLTSADIVFNANACYVFSANRAQAGCNHFESLAIHEIGHALALDHPDEFPHRNFQPALQTTKTAIATCQNPSQGYQHSPGTDPAAVMNSELLLESPVQLTLSADDLNGRNFLYPICPTPAWPKFWIYLAIAILCTLSLFIGLIALLLLISCRQHSQHKRSRHKQSESRRPRAGDRRPRTESRKQKARGSRIQK